ncbi:MAG: hypothetical protein RBR39_09565 [Proteiniphilum sp.]|nr:hypothetical protein [Proteiniphilum sp.]
MAKRFGNQYRIAIGIETSYGSGFTRMSADPVPVGSVAWADLLVHSGVINMTPTINTAPTTYKSGLTVTHPCEEVQTTSMGTVTVSGDATLDILEKYIGGVMVDNEFGIGVLEFPADTANIPSFVLYQIWDDAPTETTKFKVNRVKGAKLQQLVITGSQGGLIQFEATFETQTVEREVGQDITGNDPGRKCGTPLQFGEVVATLKMGNAATALDTFSITFTNEFTADASKFANNMTLFNPHIIKQGGEISYTCNYDSAGAETDLSIISDPDTINGDLIEIRPGENYFQAIIPSIATSLDLPDVERDYFKLNYTGRIISDGTSNVPQVYIQNT